MEFAIQREKLLKPLQMVVGAVERRQTPQPILSHVLLEVKTNQLCICATDLEVELETRVALAEQSTSGSITVPARKFIDICRTLPEQSLITVTLDEQRVIVKSGRARFTLTTLPADDFPNIDQGMSLHEFTLSQQDFRYLIESTYFSMAQNDVRYYLNGLMIQQLNNQLTAVATDGHRLAVCHHHETSQNQFQIIIPRKGVTELLRLLNDKEEQICVSIAPNHIRVSGRDFTFISKLIDGRFPDYERVIPKLGEKEIVIDKDQLRDAMSRVSILSNEKYRGVRVQLSNNTFSVLANNPEQEEAQEDLEISYDGEVLDIGFNVGYLLDVLSNLPSGPVKLFFNDSKSSLLMRSDIDSNRLYVVMPMRL